MAEPVRFQHFEVPIREDGSLHELGRGAMGITYKAFDTNLRSFVALKVINAAYLSNEVARQRFLREARAAAALRHPNVATVFHLGEEGGNYFYAMEFVDGETVETMMKRQGALPIDTALEIVLQVSRALGAAHKQALVHRDIKPSNLMIIREDDGEFTVKVIDFGLAKISGNTSSEDAATLTIGGFLGTPHFASPEQLDELDLDVRSDIYSLGITLFYMLAGRAPFSGSLAQVMSQQLHREPPLESLSDQPKPVLDLLRHMLVKDPARRPQTPVDLRHEVEACLASLISHPFPRASFTSVDQENFETQALPNENGMIAVEVVPGAELGGRYRILSEVRFSELGKVFKAERIDTSEPVALVMLGPALLLSAEACTRLEEQVALLQKIDAPALQKVFSVERFNLTSCLTLEWVEGPNLLDLLRTRKALPLAEALAILRPLAFGFDALSLAGLPCPEIALHDVFVPGIDVSVPVPAEVFVKFIAISPGVGDASPEGTLVTSPLAMMRESGAFSGNDECAYVYTIATLSYELLGGMRSGSSSGTPVPVAGLTETANSAMRRALRPSSASFSSCIIFLDAMEGREVPENEEEIPEVDFASQSAPPVNAFVHPVIHPPPGGAAGLVRRPAFWIAAGAVGVIFASILAFVYFKSPADSPVVKPVASLAEAATPVPTATPVPSPTPAPYQTDLNRLLGSPSTDRAATLTAMLALERDHPDKQEVHQAIVEWLGGVSRKTSGMTPGETASLRTPLEAAASTGFPEAAILLGEMTRKSDPTAALKWFLQAADQGKPDAMVRVGEMLASGNGGSVPDPSAGVKWFQRAADMQDPVAMYDLGECFLYGKGVEKDVSRAVQLLSGAAAKNNARAMNLLGDLYKNGIPELISANPDEAFRLFSSAKDLGELDAQGNLGVLYINGLGVEKDEGQAVDLFKAGAEKGNALCMFFYAMALESGVANMKADIDQAKIWYIRAAQGGNLRALDWCKQHSVPVGTPAGASP